MGARRKTIRIEIPADTSIVSGLRSFIARLARRVGFDDYEGFQIEALVDELCSNAIEHGTRDGNGMGKIEVACFLRKGQIELIISDKGDKEFNIGKVFARNRRRIEKGWSDEELMCRGRGLIIVQALADELKIETLPKKGTRVKVVKRHKPAKERKKAFAFPK